MPVTCFLFLEKSMKELSAPQFLDIIENQRYGCEYQPLVHTFSGEVAAYEALARFQDANGKPVAPAPVFRALHDSPLTLYNVECSLKQLQIQHAPPGYALFLNVAVVQDLEQNHILQLLQSRNDLVVEIIENSNLADARISKMMADLFNQHRIRSALDDIGASESLLSLDILMAVDYLKLDREWLQNRTDKNHRLLLNALVQYAHGSGKMVVLEGVETEQDLHFAREIGADYVQGFLYRELFHSWNPK
jgi:EAL domain-containing protein (putative c-di-GMP-specific phosphodiesterase class I)